MLIFQQQNRLMNRCIKQFQKTFKLEHTSCIEVNFSGEPFGCEKVFFFLEKNRNKQTHRSLCNSNHIITITQNPIVSYISFSSFSPQTNASQTGPTCRNTAMCGKSRQNSTTLKRQRADLDYGEERRDVDAERLLPGADAEPASHTHTHAHTPSFFQEQTFNKDSSCTKPLHWSVLYL